MSTSRLPANKIISQDDTKCDLQHLKHQPFSLGLSKNQNQSRAVAMREANQRNRIRDYHAQNRSTELGEPTKLSISQSKRAHSFEDLKVEQPANLLFTKQHPGTMRNAIYHKLMHVNPYLWGSLLTSPEYMESDRDKAGWLASHDESVAKVVSYSLVPATHDL